MRRQPVRSTSLRSVGYDPASRVLEVEFVAGRVYQYLEVPASVYRGLMRASSHGQYLNRWVKPRYEYRRVR